MALQNILFSIISISLCSCASLPYTPHPATEDPLGVKLRVEEPQIERGRPHKLIDGLGHYLFSLPSKLVLWNWSIENHSISAETEEALKKYLADNNLVDVKVRLNQYSPGAEWSRLFRNKAIGAGWRYTLGILSVVGYTIFPGRVFGGDSYNPYTNTISIYSDHPAVAMHEGGHAKDISEHEYRGSYAAIRLLPLLSLVHEGRASSDALSYMQDKQDRQGEKNGYKVLYPAFGTYIGGEITLFYPALHYASLLMAIPGHIVGRIRAAMVEDPEELEPKAGGEERAEPALGAEARPS